MFIIFLHDFGMIWLELTRTNVVFSRTTVVLFLCRNRSSRNALKSTEIFSGKYKKYWNEELPEGSPVGPMRVEGAPTPWGAPLCLVDSPWVPPDLFSMPTSHINTETSRK